ncbi:carbamoyl-phosphate synthase (glutamine-hydrolyzing) small subunit [Bacteroides thetaiotaomicron]|uniref:Carbamoyl phosphate synthase small chain n=1 Tax=Bacteroides thetaiotaomicron TaxID=818 RepID=A0A7J5JLC8_BACT4|nr:glutamine-hydrolyzing carbamoyl-phosphate synthase small subunit [Bacteroides thetaiotaomicron]KAB4424629.1 glutamine-hydrolyzing carbamoyl-phosphate synthase small subunit [Bacteroides thetaiotaomicron]KAB4427176.1 glutamine-hydrolyzing carbamoyl-phosphate synthase small subunit [Bacteroides thetaiotaomicron]KAB4431215.1 glutamine-hydrolyzing carbamoyl-phosphate synthase small subunit [Bacteroides thetaiotaomicron]KAB4439587.1 glutamine-hydrolyzing carbamoyl-phosphate synthase small subunit
MRNVTLILDDGSRFSGKSFGYEKPVAGEVVFNTAMTGYPESLTDPSYAGQLMTLTYPLVGNYGVPPFTIEPNGLATFMESEKIHAEAIIVSDYSSEYSHWNAVESLGDWLKREKVPGITGIDTRELTKILREHGVMMGCIVFDDEIVEEIDNGQLTIDNYAAVNYVDRVSCKEIISYLPDGTSRSFPLTMPVAQLNCQLSTVNCQLKKVVLVDCGVKTNIIRCLLKRGVEVIRVPWDYDFNGLEFDGLFISNGPGDPDTCDAAVQNIRKAMANEKLPIFGICMGNQLLSKAGGAKIYKLKYGHRSHNQPVRMVGTERCFITSQNHGYAVDNNTLGADWEPLFINMNDGSNEGIKHKKNPWFSAQFHPEAASGPTDTEFLFDEFVNLLK